MERDGVASTVRSIDKWIETTEHLLREPLAGPLVLLQLLRDGKHESRRLIQQFTDPRDIGTTFTAFTSCFRKLQNLAENELAKLSDPEKKSRCLDNVEQQLREDESYLSDLLTRPDIGDLSRAYLLYSFRWDLQWYSTALSLLEDEASTDPTVVAEAHVDGIRVLLASLDDPLSPAASGDLQAKLRHVEREILQKRIRSEVQRTTTDARSNELWTRRFLLSRLQAEVEYLAGRPETVADSAREEVLHWSQQLSHYRDQLARSAVASVESLDSHKRLEKLKEIVLAADGDVKEIVTLLEDLPLDESVRTIELTHEDMRQVHEACKILSAQTQWVSEERQEANQLLRQTRRLERLTGKFRVDKFVTQKMRAIFGESFVRFLNSLVLVLILAITGLFIEEMYFALLEFPPWSLGDHAFFDAYFAWLDLGICSVLMAEFLLKFALADRKWTFLKDPQHWLGEFLASIPFAFLAHYMSRFAVLEGFHLLRLMRLSRLPRLARLGRLVLFAQRALDHIVRRHANVFNRNIILFEPEETEAPETRHRHLLFTIREHFERRSGEVFNRLAVEERLALAGLVTDELGVVVDNIPIGEGRVALARTPPAREIRVEALVRELIEMTPERLVEQMGQSFAVSISRYIQMFDVALIRRLPVINPLITSSQKGTAEVAALAMNYAGHFAQTLLNFVFYLADLQGTISAPIFLDRLGTTMVNATQRPAKRLLTMGVLVLAVTVFFWAFDIRQQVLNNRLRFAEHGIEAVIKEADHPMKELSFPVQERRTIAGVDSLVLRHANGSTFVVPREWTDLADPPPSLAASISSKLNKLFGWPVIVLGLICLIPLLIGRWLRKIANQAVEQSERLVEAQFAAQTKALKAQNLKQDWRFLAERVIAPEMELRSCDDNALQRPQKAIDFETIGTPADVFLQNPELIFLHNVELLYDDYLDGAVFHRSDNKTTTQLLGNIALTNLRRRNLEHSIKESKRLHSLDLGRSTGGLLGGPYLWFNYITRMITQETAKLLTDYNRHAIPLDQLSCSPRQVRQEYRQWLASRLSVPVEQIQLPEPVGFHGDEEYTPPQNRRDEADYFFESVDFTAIDFLSDNPARSREIELKYGPLVAQLMSLDRQANVRRAFRSFPLHTVPLPWRTINLYQLYETYMANGRALLMPFRVLRWIGSLVFLAVRRTFRLIRDILNPRVVLEESDKLDSYTMAHRKIHRMRKPAYMESLWLRARFDVEYLGLTLPLVPLTLGSDSLLDIDLEYIGATRRDRLAAERLRQKQRENLIWIERWLRELGWDFHSLPHYLEQNFPYLMERTAEVLRALVTAFILDHDDVFTLGASIQALEMIVEHTRDPENKTSSLPQGLPPVFDYKKPLWYRLKTKKRELNQLFQIDLFAGCDASHRLRLARCLRKNRLATKGWLAILLSQGGEAPKETLRKRLIEVILRTDLWSSELLALRTIQTLTMLDVHHYGEMVWKLGGYDQIENRHLTTGLPIQNRMQPA